MSKRDNIIEHFKMMGYHVIENHDDTVDVRLMTDCGYGCIIKVNPDDFNKDFIIEQVVRLINGYIVRGFVGGRL